MTGLVALEIAAPGHTFRVQTLFAGDELGWSALLMGTGKQFQARTLERVDALAFEGAELLAACREDTQFGFILMQRLLGVVSERLQATRLQLLDMLLAGGGAGRRVTVEAASRAAFSELPDHPAGKHGDRDREQRGTGARRRSPGVRRCPSSRRALRRS